MERQNAAPCKSYGKLHRYSSHTINKILPYSQDTIKAMQNGMTGRNTFQYVLINTSILQRRRWGVWRVEASSNCTLLFLKQKTSFMSCVLSGLSPPGHWASTAPRTRWLSAPCITKIYSCIAFMNTNTSFSNKPTQQIWVMCTTYRLWKLSLTQRQLNDCYQLLQDWLSGFCMFLERARLTALETRSFVYPHNKHSTGRSMWS